ncbi:unnamed protein product [Aphanomyces euteiches]|uniref:RING-type domain-containing protein n=1 Tax=Aphanomyces euteiches TaxID=100861 RepID=A0A6G0WMH7_9STRA|nr:hypothetical protein Ae201684_013515 [Aphanomyces euteiches]KAH9093558.1 hypothetical protein Ae201684P_016185 [Aphanomyces euteiches]KAH9129521.1 hypothetical protein AeMF1_000448 [Aphanomyces euteiches]KAH9140942.1 hypothetical protein AeRB84_014835 [Aphanomyces euteiches]KAH9192542.1 hypothetical protein AeNC1_005477 [Aphanomyces euteiches]
MASFPGCRWFDYVSMRVSDAPSKGTVSSGRHKSALYAIAITNRSTNATATVIKSDFDFHTLRDEAQRLLDHGHQCQAACPWYYVDVSEHVPKKRLFAVMETSRTTITAHVRLYQALLEHTIAFVLCPENQVCPKATEAIPQLFFDFFFHELEGIDTALLHVPTEESPNKPSPKRYMSYRNETKSKHEKLASTLCSLCDSSLSPHAGQTVANGLTKLACGHVFHDECILEALNQSPNCPTCHGLSEIVR